jgi:hypothetical protein
MPAEGPIALSASPKIASADIFPVPETLKSP